MLSRKWILIAAAVVILAVVAAPVWAATSEDTEAADKFAELFGFEDAEALAKLLNLQDEEEATLDSNQADEFAKALGFASAEALADYLDRQGGEDEIARLLRDNQDPNELAKALGFEDARELAKALDVDSRAELAAFLRLKGGEAELTRLLRDSEDADELAQALGFKDATELARFVQPSEEGGGEGELAALLSDDGAGNAGSGGGGGYTGVINSEVEQEAESGDVALGFSVSNEGDYSSQCAPVVQAANTGNFNNAPIFNQYASEAGDFEPGGISFEVSPELAVQCEQEIQQAAAASG
jgi:hypothetical protein